ncbi:MAG: hypothetical protein GX288_02295 [Clostridiales bacterium]|nr:hypothetical protein [Clostridiales bacterium]
MIYIFIIALIYIVISKREIILSSKKNIALYILFSIIGIALGVLYVVNPYLPSLANLLEKSFK